MLQMMRSNRIHDRRKVNCLCRCTPQSGIVALNPTLAQALFDERMRRLLSSTNPGEICAYALRTGELLEAAGRPLLALRLMHVALNHLLSVDADIQEDYAANHHWPRPEYSQWYEPWSWRVSDADARSLAERIDELSNRLARELGHDARSHQRQRVRDFYEELFSDIYEVS